MVGICKRSLLTKCQKNYSYIKFELLQNIEIVDSFVKTVTNDIGIRNQARNILSLYSLIPKFNNFSGKKTFQSCNTIWTDCKRMFRIAIERWNLKFSLICNVWQQINFTLQFRKMDNCF